MGKVIKIDLPPTSGLWASVKAADFIDCYSHPCDQPLNEAAKRALTFPWWAGALLALRNAIVRPLGLRTTLPAGPMLGHFPIISETQDELILGFDDKHLDFKIAFLIKDRTAYGATWVRPHNWLGRVYLTAVMPFHVLIMRSAMARVS